MGAGFDLDAEHARLKAMPMGELKAEYERVWGWAHSTHNRSTLIRRILWRRVHGPLSPEVVARAREIAQAVMVREIPPPGWPGVREVVVPVRLPARDPRLPAPGTVLRRAYRGVVVTVTVGEHDFEYEGVKYSSLTAVARAITGAAWNGYLFFGLAERKRT